MYTVGLTIHDYIQRRRLTEAAKLLVFSDKPIMEIALLAGYASQQAFIGVFKAMYKKSPLQFRRNEVFYPLQLEYKFTAHSKPNPEVWISERKLRFADEPDIPRWMDLVRLVIDGFPLFTENRESQRRYSPRLLMSDIPCSDYYRHNYFVFNIDEMGSISYTEHVQNAYNKSARINYGGSS